MIFDFFQTLRGSSNELEKQAGKEQHTVQFLPANRTYEITRQMEQNDRNFSTDRFLKYAEDVFYEIHRAIAGKNLPTIKDIISVPFYNLLVKQEDNGITEAIEIEPKGTMREEPYLFKHEVTSDAEYLVACILFDSEYEANDILLVNKLYFRRELNRQNNYGRAITEICKCNNCGASYNKIVAGKCEYCKADIVPFAYEWVLTDFEVKKYNIG